MNDKRLFEKVNKYLYDTPERTKITMEWVSANCDIVREKTLAEVEKMIDDYPKGKGEWNKYYIKIRELKQELQKLKEKEK